MAYQEYTPEQLRAFALNKIFNARQSAIKAASVNQEGKGKTAKALLKEAKEYEAYLLEGQPTLEEIEAEYKKAVSGAKESSSKKSSDKRSSDTVPVPSSLNQKKVMDKIAEKVGAKTEQEVIALRKSVLAWVKEVFDGNQYPSKEASIEKYLSWRESNG
jgi:hypothetical protein